MSDTVLIVLIVAIAVVVILVILRDKVRTFSFKGGKDGVGMDLSTQKEEPENKSLQSENAPIVKSISGNRLSGERNEINANTDFSKIDNNRLDGKDNKINANENAEKGK
jgi:hypothetical protein